MLKVLEIKLYGLSPEKFEEKIDNKRREFYSMCKAQNRTKEESESLYSLFYANKNTYDNYSIGYLQVLYDGSALYYEAQIMLSEKYSSQKEIQKLLANLELDDTLAKKIKKSYILNYHIGGVYTGISGLTNYEIAQAIRKDISTIKKDDLLKSVYFDLSYFNNIIEYIDFIDMFEKYKRDKTNL